ncbi:TolB family protein [Falsiroseomonas sp. HW251]|uniref:TolB family protein n=1 Tax=Falsiroseomonas sp. HW251 TaxID=3390998 RepID=UPI003D314BC2
MADTLDWDAVATDVLANYEATGQWYSSGTPSFPVSVDWNAVAAEVLANLEATGQWWYFQIPSPGPTAGAVVRTSTSAAGAEANERSLGASLSGDGTKVAFESLASNVIGDDLNGATDVFVKDLVSGGVSLVRASASGQTGSGASFEPSLSSDGGLLAFTIGSFPFTEVFVQDLRTGELTPVGETGRSSGSPSLSADGTIVAFTSSLVTFPTGPVPPQSPHAPPNPPMVDTDVVVRDFATGRLVLASASENGEEGNGRSFQPAISRDGTKVAFVSDADNLVPGDDNGTSDVFVKDLVTGAITLVSASSAGEQGNSGSLLPSISADGTRVAFESFASNLVPGDDNGTLDIFVKDLISGAVTLASTSAEGEQGNGRSEFPSLSIDGRRVAFVSEATNLLPGDANTASDVFVKDLVSGAITLASASSGGEQGNGSSGIPSLSADGNMIAFDSEASNLVPGDTNGVLDVFVKNLDGAFAAGAAAPISDTTPPAADMSPFG